MLDGVEPLMIFFFRNRDDFRNQINIRILIRRNRLCRFRRIRDGDSCDCSRLPEGCVPGHALHEKGLQRQKSVVPLVGSQEQRALLVPVLNW